MKKTTIISVMAVLWHFTNKDKRTKTNDKGQKLKAESQQRTPINLNKSYPAFKGCGILLLIFGVFMSTVWAQNAPLKPLMVGDKVPASFWEQKHAVYQDGKTTTQTLAQHKGKLLLLDFWATWCGPCISAFPKLLGYQQKYQERVAVVLVSAVNTQDKAENILAVLKSSAKHNQLSLPSVINDSTLLGNFPHVVIPHYVWIIDGSIRAISTSEFLTEENIISMLTASDRLNKPKNNKL